MTMQTTHNPNISITIFLAANPAQEAGFGTVLLLVPKSTNSLNGVRVVEYVSYDDAYDANVAGYISSSTLSAVQVAFSQSPKPTSIKVGFVDDTAATPAVKASKDMSTVGTHAWNTVLEATTAGVDGSAITVELVADAGGAVTIARDGTAFQIHFKPGVSTITNVETAITALAGADDLFGVKTAGTGATVLAVVDANMGATHLSGGADAVATEGYDDGLASCITFDSDFYGVCIASRLQAAVVDVSTYIEASSKRMLFCAQDNDPDWYSGAVPAGLSTISAYERTIIVYHTTDSEWGDVGHLCNRLTFDPDSISAPWHGNPVASVADLSPEPTATQRLAIIANNANLGLPYGGYDYVMDPGVNINGRPVYEVLTADWFATRLQERTSSLVVAHSVRGEKIIVDKSGQKKLGALIDGLGAQGVAAHHFADGQFLSVAETITTSDLSNRKLRFTVRAQDAVAARLFDFSLYFSRDPIAQ